MRNCCLFIGFGLGFALIGSPASGAIITQNLPGLGFGSTNFVAIGQSITTPSGGPWTNLTFNLYDASGAPLPGSNGILYLLSSEYLGLPSGLSNLVPGFLASTNSLSLALWTFAPSVSVAPNTQYFLYTNTLNNARRHNGTGVYSGGIAYSSPDPGSNSFVAEPASDTAFTFSGIQVSAVPEPGTITLFGVGLAAIAMLRRRH